MDTISEEIQNLLKEVQEGKHTCEPLAAKLTQLLGSLMNEAKVEERIPEHVLKNIIMCFDEAGVNYAVIGGQAVNFHNYERGTMDIDFLVSAESFPRIERFLIGQRFSYVTASSRKKLFFTSGNREYPVDIVVEGDFLLPDPRHVRFKQSGIWYITLAGLIDYKLRSRRRKDRNDVVELMEGNGLSEDFAAQLSPEVREAFLELLKEPRS